MFVKITQVIIRASQLSSVLTDADGFDSTYGIIVRGNLTITEDAANKLLKTTFNRFQLCSRCSDPRQYISVSGKMTLDDAFYQLNVPTLPKCGTYKEEVCTLDIIGELIEQRGLLLFHADGEAFKYFLIEDYAPANNEIDSGELFRIVLTIPGKFETIKLSPRIQRRHNADREVTIWMRNYD